MQNIHNENESSQGSNSLQEKFSREEELVEEGAAVAGENDSDFIDSDSMSSHS